MVDVYCGLGGFTCGATMDGKHEALLGIDNCVEALSCYKSNTNAGVMCKTLPADIDWQLEDTHTHFSPPCTSFSRARCQSAADEEKETGVERLRWCLETMAKTDFASCSLETVSVPATRRVLDEFVRAHPTRLAYHAFECADFGVAQFRRRIICGRPILIERLKAAPIQERVSVASVFGDALPSPFLKNTTVSRTSGSARCVRTVKEPAFTVCGARVRGNNRPSNLLSESTKVPKNLVSTPKCT